MLVAIAYSSITKRAPHFTNTTHETNIPIGLGNILMQKISTRILIFAGLVLSYGLCLAEDLPKATNEITSLTAEQAAKLVANTSGPLLSLDNLNLINSSVANSLGNFRGSWLRLNSLTSIDKDTAQELAKFNGALYLDGLTSLDEDTAKKLAQFKGAVHPSCFRSFDKDTTQAVTQFKGAVYLYGLNSVDEGVLGILKSNPDIKLPEKYRD